MKIINVSISVAIISMTIIGCGSEDSIEPINEPNTYNITKEIMANKLENANFNPITLSTDKIILLDVDNNNSGIEKAQVSQNILIAYGGELSQYIYIMNEYSSVSGERGQGIVLYLDVDNNISTGKLINTSIGAEFQLSTAGYREYEDNGSNKFTYNTGGFSSNQSGLSTITGNTKISGYNLDYINNLSVNFNNKNAILRYEDNTNKDTIKIYGQTMPFIFKQSY